MEAEALRKRTFNQSQRLAAKPRRLARCKTVAQNGRFLNIGFFSMLIGYARVSTTDQDPTQQIDTLQRAGCQSVYSETASGAKWDRPELGRMLGYLRPGDVVIVWKLDRLSRSLKDLLTLIEKFDRLGVGFRSLTEAVDTTTPAGKMMLQMIGVFAEFERSMIQERTRAGLIAARQQGRTGGRPAKLNTHQIREAVKLVKGGKTAAEVARLFNVDRATIGRYVAATGDEFD